jgi:hypothetical protein
MERPVLPGWNLRNAGRAAAAGGLLLLVACGGGGDGGTPSAPRAVTVTPAISSVSQPINGTPPVVGLTIHIDTAYQNDYLFARYSTDGIATLSGSLTSATDGAITLVMKAPGALTKGVHADTIDLRLCSDSPCNTPIAGATASATINYTVTAPLPGSEPSIQFTPTAIVRTDHPILGLASTLPAPGPSSVVTFDMNNIGVTPNVQVGSYTTNAVTSVGLVGYSSSSQLPRPQGSLSVQFNPALNLPLGSYHDSITVVACLDPNCVNPLPGSPFTIPVDYTLSNTISVGGANGYTWQPLLAEGQFLAWSPTTGKLTATNPWIGPQHPQTLVTSDPVTLQAGAYVPLPGAPTALALSPDGSHAYVGTYDSQTGGSRIQKVRLADGVVVGNVFIDTYQGVDEIILAPGAGELVAVATHVDYTLHDLHLVDMATLTKLDTSGVTATQSNTVLSPAWGSDAGTLYAYDAYSDALCTFHPSGGQLGMPTCLTADLAGTYTGGSHVRYSGGRLYESHGGIYDLASGQLQPQVVLPMANGSQPNNPRYSMLDIDSANHRAYYLYSDGGPTTLGVVDLNTMQMTGSLALNAFGATSIVRFGRDGLAYATDGHFVGILTGPFVVP